MGRDGGGTPSRSYQFVLPIAGGCEEQTCWLNKAGKVLDNMPDAAQSKAKATIHDMWQARSREKALKAYRHLCTAWEQK